MADTETKLNSEAKSVTLALTAVDTTQSTITGICIITIQMSNVIFQGCLVHLNFLINNLTMF